MHHSRRTLAAVLLTSAASTASGQVVFEVFADLGSFQARLGGVPELVHFDDIDTSSDPALFAADRYTSTLGITITGLGGQVASRDFRFPIDFPPWSPPNMYAAGPVRPVDDPAGSGTNETNVTFGCDVPGLVAGFGAFFIDADFPGEGPSSLTVFGPAGQATTGIISDSNGSRVFRGIVAIDVNTNTPVRAIQRARLIAGNGYPGVNLNEGVALDDFWFSGCCDSGGTAINEPITDFPSCGPAGKLMPKWGRFGKKAVLESDAGEKLELECVAGSVNWYGLFFTPKGGARTRVGVCPFEAGCNYASFFHAGDENSNRKPDCFVRTRWISKDHGKNDNPNPWTGEASENELDWAESVFEAKDKNLTKTDYKFNYLVVPPLHKDPSVGHTSGCPHVPKAEGNLVTTTVVDPPLGPETEAFFDTVIGALQGLPPGNAMEGDFSLPCDFDGDADCDGADFQAFQTAFGSCRGDSTYQPQADADADGCVTATDQADLFNLVIDIRPGSRPNSINPASLGVVAVAILAQPFSVPTSEVDPGTVTFGATGTEAAPVRSALEDVDADGDLDMILHFNTHKTGILCGETSAYLTAKTFGGEAIKGVDSVRTVGCK